MKRIFWLFSLIIVHSLSYGQLINIENQRIQNDSIRIVTIIDLQYNYQNNNSEELSQVNFSGTYQHKTKNLKNYFLLLGNIDYSLANGEELSNSGLIHFRYNRKLNKKLRLEAFNQYQYNKILGVESRNLIGIGPRYKINKSDKNVLYIGSLLMQEFEKTSDNIKTMSYQRLSNYFSLSIKNKAKTLELTSVVYYQPNINFWEDYRLSSQTNLAFNITSRLQFVNSINYGYDSYAPSNVSKKNIVLTNGLKMYL
ncbi:Protein of unknown function DUF481 [Flavobacteriaceae bacterium]